MSGTPSGARRRDEPDRPVAFHFRSPPQHALPVELYGDFRHWFVPHEMAQQPSQPGATPQWSTTLSVPPGVYAYKFRTLDGRWHLDADNPRTRTVVSGLRNSLLVIEGSDEPVLHAPRAPFLFWTSEGRLWLRAGLRRGHGETLSLHTVDGDGQQHVSALRRMPLADEVEHLLFEGPLSFSARHVDYLFALEDGRRIGRSGCGQALRISEHQLPPAPPSWWQHAVVYTIFVDRFRRRDAAWPVEPRDEKARLGGDLWGVRDALPYLQDLGVNVLHLTPIAQSPSAHRYDAENPLAIDPALGGEPALLALLEAAQKRGMRLLADLVHTHVHRHFLPFCDVRLRGRASPFADWFHILRHPFSDTGDAGPDPGYAHYQKGQWHEPLLRHDQPVVIDYLCRVAQHYIQRGFSGLRIDAASDAPPVLLRRLRQAVGPNALLLGEVTTDNLATFAPRLLHAATDFSAQRALLGWLGAGESRDMASRSTPEITQAAACAFAQAAVARGAPESAVIFSATHDQPRVLSRIGDPQRARLALVLVLLQAPVPALLYGDEIGLHAQASAQTDPASHAAARDFDDAWPDRLPFPWQATDSCLRPDETTRQLVRDLLRLRRSLPALHQGHEEFFTVHDAPDVLAFRRRAGDEIVEIYARPGDAASPSHAAHAQDASASEPCLSLRLSADAPPGATLLLTCGQAALQGLAGGDATDTAAPRLLLSPWSAAVIARHATPTASALWDRLTVENRVVVEAAFRHGATQGLFLPAHLYVTITERCNLRCQHCITDAPVRTQEGRARTLQPWLVDALSPAFAAADYVAFVHGGESLLAPIFFDVLSRIQQARGGRPCSIHLLSNGMLLSETIAHRLIDRGLTSLSISLDGGTAATNDALRIGADFERILRNLEAVLDVRTRRGADLRVGVSVVLTRDNQHELSALAERLASLGIDWLKLEEMHPINLIAAEQLVDPRTRSVYALRGELRRILKGRVVFVDHLQDEGRCPCALSEEHMGSALADGDAASRSLPVADPDCAACSFRFADDFANRAHFHSCRSDWEQACIDPDGVVHPVSYDQPAVGSLAQASLLDLWQGQAMQQRRAEALARVPAVRRSGCTR